MLCRRFQFASIVLLTVVAGACCCSQVGAQEPDQGNVVPEELDESGALPAPEENPTYPNGQVTPPFGQDPNIRPGQVIFGQIVGGLINHMQQKQQAKMERERFAAEERRLQMQLNADRQRQEMEARAQQEANRANEAQKADEGGKKGKGKDGKGKGPKGKPAKGAPTKKSPVVLPGGVPFRTLPAVPKPPRFGF